MITKRDLIIGLTVFCVVALLFSAIPVIGQTGEYDPWLDINDDGYIGIDDIFTVASHFGAEGQNITKAGLLYDSGWINVTDKAGQNILITHALNITNWNDSNMMVDIVGKTAMDGGLLRYLGLGGYTSAINKTYGGTQGDAAYSLIQTSDGGYALTGYTGSYGVNIDVWLVKTDSFGRAQWNRTYGGSSYDYANSIAQTSDGGYILAGITNSYGAGSADVYVVKTYANGSMQWNKTYGGSGYESAACVVQSSGGGYVVAGQSASNNDDFWLIKIDALGNAQWNKTYGGLSGDYAWSLIQTGDGGYAMAGETGSSGAGHQDFWLVKTDSSGIVQWNKTYGGTSDDWAQSVVQTGDGGYALVGFTDSFDVGAGDFWLVKTDSVGNAQWNKTYGGAGLDWGMSLVQALDGGYALTGYTRSLGAGADDVWLVKTDSSGNAQWNKTYGGSTDDWGYSVVITSEQTYALACTTTSYGAGSQDAWLIKLDTAASGLAWTDSSANTVTLYRGATDPYWNFVRVRIWAGKENP